MYIYIHMCYGTYDLLSLSRALSLALSLSCGQATPGQKKICMWVVCALATIVPVATVVTQDTRHQ